MGQNFDPVQMIELAADRLGDLCEKVTFLGGVVVTLLLDDPGSRRPRPTTDVDVTIELASRTEFYELEQALRTKGFENAIEGPICRFRHGSTVLDVMPTNPEILGFSNPWYRVAIQNAIRNKLSNGKTINVVDSACFLATKLQAFESPNRENRGDKAASHDFEDVVTVIDGRPEIVNECRSASVDVRLFLSSRFLQLTRMSDIEFGVGAHIDETRIETVISRMRSIAENPESA